MVAGGNDGGAGSTNTVFLYDVEANTWNEVAPMLTSRLGAAAVTLPGKGGGKGGRGGRQVMVVGGHDAAGHDELDTVELYTMDDVPGGPGSWSTMPAMQTARKHPAAAVLEDGRVVVAGKEAER